MQKIFLYFLIGISLFHVAFCQNIASINSGIPWYDQHNRTVSAHGANILRLKNTFYLFGESHSDTSNAFVGFNCYSSRDLANWKFESIALPLQASGKLGPNRVGERPKVMRCPSTGEFVMYMHVDTLGYTDQFVGYATAKEVTGPYTFQGPLLYDGKFIRKWDMGAFQDADGKGYVLLHGGDIYQLNKDYKSVDTQICKAFEKGFESPALFKKDSLYFFLGSNLTGWERNDNYYFTSKQLQGPWERKGVFAPQGSLTWNSQTSFVLPIATKSGKTFIYMGDRWSFPYQASAATYVWQPLQFEGDKIKVTSYLPSWQMDLQNESVNFSDSNFKYIPINNVTIDWSELWNQDTLLLKSANEKNASFSFSIKARQVGLYGLSRPDGGYARVDIFDSNGEQKLSSIIDCYAAYPMQSLLWKSPFLPQKTYSIKVTVLGQHWYWKEKSGRITGSKGTVVSLEGIDYR